MRHPIKQPCREERSRGKRRSAYGDALTGVPGEHSLRAASDAGKGEDPRKNDLKAAFPRNRNDTPKDAHRLQKETTRGHKGKAHKIAQQKYTIGRHKMALECRMRREDKSVSHVRRHIEVRAASHGDVSRVQFLEFPCSTFSGFRRGLSWCLLSDFIWEGHRCRTSERAFHLVVD